MYNVYSDNGDHIGESEEFVDACAIAVKENKISGQRYHVVENVWNTDLLSEDVNEEMPEAA